MPFEHSPRCTVDVEAVNDLEFRLERQGHDMKRAWQFAGRLIKQNVALDLSPSEAFIESAHPIDAKEQRIAVGPSRASRRATADGGERIVRRCGSMGAIERLQRTQRGDAEH